MRPRMSPIARRKTRVTALLKKWGQSRLKLPRSPARPDSEGPEAGRHRQGRAVIVLACRLFYHPCFGIRLGGVSGGKESQGWRDSSHTAMVGAGKSGSAKLPMATMMYPGKLSLSQ
jgi:hypothetical protein